ncbi:sigma-54 interaction domain-containing protein [Bacillus sp. Marseille-P3800]|uniref:sigma-54 interaction domain-containing protein n=1 Tax=Bacillus sp. Marseille-P3800 TaxID=2014782 RepID=UPI000C07D635|nr:sigma 54-interacting transcriptional regulator [Bacillus sp. Marseille-P3800]
MGKNDAVVKANESLSAVVVKMIKGNHISMNVKDENGRSLGELVLSDVRQAIQSGRERDSAITLLQNRPETASSNQFESMLKSEMFAILMDSLYDGVYVTDGTGVTLKVNQAYERITGIPAQTIIGMHMRDMEKAGYISNSISLEVLKQKKVVTRMQRLASGRKALVSGTPSFNDAGEIEYVVSTVRDMTDLLRMQAELEDLKEWQAERAHYVTNQDETPIVAEDEQTISFLTKARRVAETTATVCLLGESGVGKTKVATYIHEHSQRKDKPFVVVNCGALSETLIEAELFGYAPGAFTGALTKGKKGLIEVAHGGTLFLDEVGELPHATQVKLLKVLDDFHFTPVGSTEGKRVDIRVIAATNRDLNELVKRGQMREDFYYRMAVVPLFINPLRHRPKEILRLTRLFLSEYNNRYNRHVTLGDEALHAIQQWHWPGNIRELKNAIDYVVATTPVGVAGKESLPKPLWEEGLDEEDGRTLKDVLQAVEKRMIEEAIVKHKTTRAAANALKISQAALVTKRQSYRNLDQK